MHSYIPLYRTFIKKIDMRSTPRIKYLLLLLVVFVSSCSQSYKIEGTSSIRMLDGKKLYIKAYSNDEWIQVDSAEIVHGNFYMTGSIDSTYMAMLFMDNNAIMPFIMEGGNLRITLSNSLFMVKGTPLNDSLYTFLENRNQFDIDLENLKRKEARMMMNGYSIAQIQNKIEPEEKRILFEKQEHTKNFIKRNYNNILGTNTFIMLCGLMQYPIITPLIQEILDDAPESFISNTLIYKYVQIAEENQKLLDMRNSLLP